MTNITAEECETISINQIINGETEIEWVEINSQIIEITQSRCNYGGFRKWFICPQCNKRIGNLYRKPLHKHFYCRYCQNLTYQLRKYHRSPSEEFIKRLKGGVGL